MLLQRLIPTLLLKDKRLVKGQNYQQLRDAGNPRTTARVHNHQGADELIILDIIASNLQIAPDIKSIQGIAEECFIPLCVGGGINTLEIAQSCLDVGADKLFLSTTAMDQPELISKLAQCFGSQAIVVGIDITYDKNNEACLFDHRSHTIINNKDPWDWLVHVVELGAGEVRLMAVDREGTFLGYDFSLYQKARGLVDVPIILEGGAGSLEHLQMAFEKGVDGVATGAMLVFSDSNLIKIKKHMITNLYKVRE